MSILELPNQVQTMLLDMNGTFMFGHDHLDEDTDFFPTYERLGGEVLARYDLNDAVREVIAALDDLYLDGDWNTQFPSVKTVISQTLPRLRGADQRLIEAVIAQHELGSVSEACLRALRALAKRFRLVVVSNLWSNSAPWIKYLAGLDNRLFSGFVFSSDIGINKPAPEIFQYALALAGSQPSHAVMVGDDFDRDIVPASMLGMRTVWVADPRTVEGPSNCVVRQLPDLLFHGAGVTAGTQVEEKLIARRMTYRQSS